MNELQHVLNFTDADLKANSAGHLSSAQRAKLRSRQQRSLRLLVGVTGIIALLLCAALLIGKMALIVFGVMALIMAVLALVEYVIGYQTYSRDLSASRIETIQGIVHYIWRGDTALGIETRASGIRIGDMQFLLMEDQARAFTEGEIYLVYLAPATHTLLSAERVLLRDELESDAEIRDWEASVREHDTSYLK